jgi:hypothetical protein
MKQGESFVIPEPATAIGFSTFILGLASTAVIHLGAAPHPESGARAIDLNLARQSLDLLDLLREKTRGNLSAEEEQLFASLLTDLRLRWVEASNSK